MNRNGSIGFTNTLNNTCNDSVISIIELYINKNTDICRQRSLYIHNLYRALFNPLHKLHFNRSVYWAFDQIYNRSQFFTPQCVSISLSPIILLYFTQRRLGLHDDIKRFQYFAINNILINRSRAQFI